MTPTVTDGSSTDRRPDIAVWGGVTNTGELAALMLALPETVTDTAPTEAPGTAADTDLDTDGTAWTVEEATAGIEPLAMTNANADALGGLAVTPGSAPNPTVPPNTLTDGEIVPVADTPSSVTNDPPETIGVPTVTVDEMPPSVTNAPCATVTVPI
jgi:hypothetical protein